MKTIILIDHLPCTPTTCYTARVTKYGNKHVAHVRLYFWDKYVPVAVTCMSAVLTM